MHYLINGGFLIVKDTSTGIAFSIDYRDVYQYLPPDYQRLVYRATQIPIRYISQVVADMWVEAYNRNEDGVMMFKDWL